ncbi:DUF420 domain-containing protein [Natronocalculus amylovorans]|uniref:DUF420 domain-containing protein n=1 Tax=Natronocalculus amylovorans TaxID=2917812 RepID=A0AAE3FUC6_9EURY|nr:DUF420 domain-containing protein [Natronocalculus amylovorans]MCL9815371.1 DUF420 domain-containing protein [Natronocalculus amylovorans]
METPVLGGPVRERPGTVTAILSVIGYVAVLGVFLVPEFAALFPELTRGQVDFLTHAIAAVNTLTIISLSLGWYWIRSGNVQKHATAMVTSFVLILVFLGMYLPRVAGGGTKYFVGPDPAYYAYLIMLAIHIALSILAVPVVLYAIVLGLTHTPEELRTQTPHKKVGRVAAGSWLLSLILGVVTYLLLNHIYDSTFEAAQAIVFIPL